MRWTSYITFSLSFLIGGLVYAQNEQDALFLSRSEVTGSARTVSMGGAFTALGGDISGAYLNPAGIAVFRDNEFSLSAGFHTHISSAEYYGRNNLDSKSNLNIPTLGIVGVSEVEGKSKWRSTAMAFGMHRNYSYHRSYSIYGQNIPSSLIDSYQKTLLDRDIAPSEIGSFYPFDIFLAWQTLILDTLNSPDYYNAAGIYPVDQSYQLTESGAKRETFFSFGGNYDDKLYIGANVNFSRIALTRNYVHSETIDPADSTTDLREFAYEFGEEFSGLGVFASAGLIYRPISSVRVGLSLRTPTVYSLDLEYESKMTAAYTESVVYDQRSPYIGQYEFRLRTPAQATLGLAYIVGKYGLVSADVDVVNYTGIRMRGISDGYQFGPEENAIQNELQSAINLRFGAEYRVTPYWSIRAGFAHFGDPYSANLVDNGSFQLYSAGFGFRNEDFFVDAAYQLRNSTTRKFLYDPTMVDPATISSADHRLTATFGFKF